MGCYDTDSKVESQAIVIRFNPFTLSWLFRFSKEGHFSDHKSRNVAERFY